VTCRVTQTYDAGACVYFYFAFNYLDIAGSVDVDSVVDPVALYEELEGLGREEVLANGGSLSHHHGIGKIRAKWMGATLSGSAIASLRQLKTALDPNNVFNNGNVLSTNQGNVNGNGNVIFKAKL
jgi:alkyldihydroxyacetonephosphate synthase